MPTRGVQGLLAVGASTDRPGIRSLAGIAASWSFGQNAAGVPVYDPATGVTRDGVQVIEAESAPAAAAPS